MNHRPAAVASLLAFIAALGIYAAIQYRYQHEQRYRAIPPKGWVGELTTTGTIALAESVETNLVAGFTMLTNCNPKPKTNSFGLPVDYAFRIRSDGDGHFWVQEKLPWRPGQWSDDIFGGYFPTLEDASNHITHQIEWHKSRIEDEAIKAKGKTVAEFK